MLWNLLNCLSLYRLQRYINAGEAKELGYETKGTYLNISSLKDDVKCTI